MDELIHPVVLCGGAGARLWPLSRKSYPKQFSNLVGDESLFQGTIGRVTGKQYGRPIIITANDFRFIVSEQLDQSDIVDPTILIEPDSRNTAPATLAAAMWLSKSNPNALMLLLPSDHIIPDKTAFTESVLAGREAALNGELLTFGINATSPETGFGWLELEDLDRTTPIKLASFKEKPKMADAEKMLAGGSHMWNAGIFLFSCSAIIKAFELLQPEMVSKVKESVDRAETDLEFVRLHADSWNQLESESLDYAVMEHAKNISVVPFNGHWSDLGGWESVWRETEQGETGVATHGEATAMDCKDTLLRSDSPGLEVVGLGLENTIVVAMSDAVLVADASRAQDVKNVVSSLKSKESKQAETFPKDHRPWGWFETLALNERFQVKQIFVKPGGILSLQSHMHRAEHWIVVSGTARVTIGDDQRLLSENQSVYIPLGETHRLENPGKLPMVLIEVQTGAYLGEDDIVRYEDAYSRG